MTFEEIQQGLWVIAGLVIIEGLLSVDNVLGIAALANELPEQQQKKAIRIGLIGAYVFRVLALLVASWLVGNTWVRWLGAGYLLWLMCSHLTRHGIPDDEGKVKAVRATFAAVLLQIGLMDLSLSIDNVIAAVGLAPKDPVTRLPVMWPVYVGVAIAILALQAIAPHAVKLLKKYPVLEPTAFVLIGYVGGILIFEEAWHVITGNSIHIPPYGKFSGILLIMWLALLYSADGAVRKMLRPLIRIVYPLMKLFSNLVSWCFFPLVWVVRKLALTLKSKPAADGPAN
jgi:YkoY family integral membrane protein